MNFFDYKIQDGTTPFIIAEIGSNHNQDIKLAKKLIDTAYEAKANAVKFQLFNTDELYSPSDNLYKVFKNIQLDPSWLEELKKYSESLGLVFFASPFDIKSVEYLEKIKVELYKIASSETTNHKLLWKIAKTKKPIIMSVGMCDLCDIQEAVDLCLQAKNNKVVLLHTSSIYPTNPSDVNLKSISKLKSTFNLPVGFSDHTLDSISANMAVAMGVNVFEKHITLDKKMQGPDHFYAANPDEFKEYVRSIHKAKSIFGSTKIGIHDKILEIARREGVYSKVELKKGSVINKNHLWIKRPASGIKPRYLNVIIGSKAKKDIKINSPLNWDDVVI